MIRKETIEDLIRLGYTLTVEPYLFNQVAVKVSRIGDKIIANKQVVPFDHHLDRLDDVIQYCINEVLKIETENGKEVNKKG